MPVAVDLNKHLKRSSLFFQLKDRDDIATIEAKKLLPDTVVASIICPQVREKISFFEALSVTSWDYNKTLFLKKHISSRLPFKQISSLFGL